MEKLATAFVVVGCSIARIAHADEAPAVDRGSIGAALMLGADGNAFESAISFEGTVRLTPEIPLYAHGVAAIGQAGDFSGGGELEHGRAGLELRQCADDHGGACVLAQFDVGYQSQTWNGMNDFGTALATEVHAGLVVGPSFGLDVGGEHTRFRAIVDTLEFHDGFDDHWTKSVTLTLGIARRLD